MSREDKPINNPDLRTTSRRRVYLIDGMAVAYRAHFALAGRPFQDRLGRDTSTLFGFLQAIIAFLGERPDYLVVAFDPAEGGTFRSLLFDRYKAHRPPTPEAIRAALPAIREILQALDISAVEVPGVEGDDVIGTLARRGEERSLDIRICSPDKDFRQLLSPRVSILRPPYKSASHHHETEATFRDRFGIEPHRYVDVLALMGDASDNVPGISGIGEKTALSLVRRFGAVEEVLERVDEIERPALREKIKGQADQALLSKQLVTIRTNVKVPEEWARFGVGEPDWSGLAALLHDFNLGGVLRRFEALDLWERRAPEPDSGQERLVSRLVDATDPPRGHEEASYEAVGSLAEWTTVLERAMQASEISIAIDSIPGRSGRESLVGLSLAWAGDPARYVPLPLPDGTPREAVASQLDLLLRRRGLTLVGYDLKHVLHALTSLGCVAEPHLADARVGYALLDPRGANRLDTLARHLLNHPGLRPRERPDAAAAERPGPDSFPGHRSTATAEIAVVGLRLHPVLETRLAERGLLEFARDIAYPFVRAIARMERRGMGVDAVALGTLEERLRGRLAEIEAAVALFGAAGLDLGSSSDVERFLIRDLGHRPDEAEPEPDNRIERMLEAVAPRHPLAALILEWRRLNRLLSGQILPIREQVEANTGRLLPSYDRTEALDCREWEMWPDLGGLDRVGEWTDPLRAACVAEEGHVLLSVELGQLSLRLLGALSADAILLTGLRQGEDPYATSAAAMQGDARRAGSLVSARVAEVLHATVPYGTTGRDLARRLKVTVADADELIARYREIHTGIAALMADPAAHVRGVSALAGHGGSEDRSARDRRGDASMRMGKSDQIADMVESLRARFIKTAVVRLDRALVESETPARLTLVAGNELLVETPARDGQGVEDLIRREVAAACPPGVSPELSITSGARWKSAGTPSD